MNEFNLMIIIQCLSAGIFLGGLVASFKYIEEKLNRLEEKQDKYNGVIERTIKNECSISALHKRMDELIKEKK